MPISYISETTESDLLGSQDYTRLGLNWEDVPGLTCQSQSSQYGYQDWSGIDWENVPEMSSSPVKDHDDTDDEHEAEEEELFVPLTQQGPPIRPIIRGFSEDSQFQLDDATMELYDQLEREVQEAAPDTRASPEDISSFTSSPRGSESYPDPCRRDPFFVSSVSSQEHHSASAPHAPNLASLSFSLASGELDLTHLDSQAIKIIDGLVDGPTPRSSDPHDGKEVDVEIFKTAAIPQGNTRVSSQNSTPKPTQEARSLRHHDSYSLADLGDATLNLNHLTHSIVQSIDAIEATFPFSQADKGKKRKATDLESNHSTQSEAESERAVKKVRLTRKSSLINVTSVAAESHALECCFCMKLLVNPQVSSSCGHTLGCETCARNWIAKHESHPTCYHPSCDSSVTSLTPNHTLIQVITKHVKLLHHLYAEWDETNGELRRDYDHRRCATM